MVRHMAWPLVILEIGSEKENCMVARCTAQPLVNLETERGCTAWLLVNPL